MIFRSGKRKDPYFSEPHDDTGPSLRPVEVDQFDDLDWANRPRELTPEQALRRARLRKIVAGIVAVVGVIGALAVLRLIRTRPEPVAAAGSILSAQPVIASVGGSTHEPASAEVAAAQGPAVEPDPAVDARALKRQAKTAVREGRFKEGLALGQKAVDADPSDAESYLLVGASLQEIGQWQRAAAVFSECANKASRGPVSECRALGGR
jgi:Flp pilus assembly protein TadD